MTVPTGAPQDPSVRSRWALQTALGILHPDAVALRNGRILLTDRRDQLRAYVVRALLEQLRQRAADRTSDDRLLAEAVGVLGAEVARARGESPGAGATAALDRYLHAPGVDQSRRTEANAVLRVALTLAALDDQAAADRLDRLTGRARPAAPSGIASASQAITLDAEMLHTRWSTPPESSGQPGPRGQVGTRHRRPAGAGRVFQTERVRNTGIVSGSRPKGAAKLDGPAALAVLAGMGPAELGASLTDRPAVRHGLAVLRTTVADEPQYVRVDVGRTLPPWVAEGKLESGTADDPHVVRISPGLADEQLRTVFAHQITQLTQELAAARAGRPKNVLNLVHSVFNHDRRDRRLKADHAAFELLAKDWRQASAETRAFGRPTGPRGLVDIQRDLEGLGEQIRFHGGVPPVLPWGPGAVQSATEFGIAAARAEAEANPPRFTPGHLRGQVLSQIENLQAAVEDLGNKSELKAYSGQGALVEADNTDRAALIEGLGLDRGAGERARKLRASASAARDKARRHIELADTYHQAATQAQKALSAYRYLLADMDLGGTPDRTSAFAAEARRQVEIYQQRVAQVVPGTELLATGVPTGKRLNLPVDDINRVLAAQGIKQRLLPDAPLPVPGAQFRRLLSPDGMVFIVGGDPDDKVGEVVQVRLRMKSRDVTEVVDHDYDLAEQMSGTLGEGGTSIGTTDTHSVSQTVGVNLQPFIAMTGAVAPVAAAAAPFVSASAGVSRGRTEATTGGAGWSAQEGRVDDNRGESLLYEWSGDYEIEVRRSPTKAWSPVETVDAGRQLTWVSSAYTVKEPAETVTLADLGRANEISKVFPRSAVTNISGLQSVSDRVVAAAEKQYGGLDRVTLEHINGLIVHDSHRLLRAAARPGGITRRIPSGGETDYALTWEVVPVWADAKLVGEASGEMWQEEVLVDFAGGNVSQVVGTSLTGAGTAGATVGPSPSATVSRNVSRQGGQNVSNTNITPYVHRSQGPTQGVQVGFEVKATLRKLSDTKRPAVVVEDKCQAFMRVAENDLLRAGGPVDKKAVRRELDGTIREDRKGRALLRGDSTPSTGPQPMPPWMGPGQNQIRGVGKGMAQALEGADDAQRDALRKLSDLGLVPKLDDNLQPRADKDAHERDPLRRAAQYANYERVIEQISAPRIQAGFNQAAQGGLIVMLEDQRTGRGPRWRPFRLSVEQDFAGTEHIGTSTNENAVLLAISSRASGHTFGQSKSVPVAAGVGLSDGPPESVVGLAAKLGLKVSRNALGRSLTYTVGTRVNRVGLNESTGPIEKFEQKLKIRFAEITDQGDSEPLAEVDGTVELAYDSALCKVPPLVFEGKPPSQPAIDAGQLVAADAGNAADKVAAALPAFRANGTALASLHAALSPNSLVANPQWMNGSYRLPMTVVRAPGSPAEALADGTLLPEQYQVVIRGEAVDLAFGAISDQNTVDINFTTSDVSVSSGTSTSGGVGVDAGTGSVGADGSTGSGGISVGRTGGRSQSTSNSQTTGDERLLVNPGTHYEFLERYKLVADIVHDGKVVSSVPLDDAVAQKAMAERRALELYASSDLDLPLEVTQDAAERWLTGKLPLEPRVAAGFVGRYREDKAGVTTGLAAGHTTELLTEHMLKVSRGIESQAPTADERLTAALSQAERAAAVPRTVHLSDPNDRSLAATQIERLVVEGTKRKVDLRELVVPQFDELQRGLVAATPVLQDALDVNLDPDSYEGHLENMLGPEGHEHAIEVPIAGQRRPDVFVVQSAVRFDGEPYVDGGPEDDDGNPELPQQEAGSLLQNYNYWGRDQTLNRTTTYSGGVNGGAGAAGGGAGVSGGVSTDRTRTHSAGDGQLNVTLDRLGHFDLVKVHRKAVFTTRVIRLRSAGSAALTSTRWKLKQLDPADVVEVSGPRELRADLTALVPRSEVKAGPRPAEPQLAPELAEHIPDHRAFRLPEGAVPIAYQPYRKGDVRKWDHLFRNLNGYLARPDMLGVAGITQYRQLIKTVLQPVSSKAEFERLVNDGIRIPPMVRQGNGRRTVRVSIQGVPTGWELKDPVQAGQVGKVRREQHQYRSSETANHATPVTVTGGFDAGVVSASATAGEQVKGQSAQAYGGRSETSKFEEGQVVTVRIPIRYDATIEVARDRGHTGATANETVRLGGLAEGEYFVRMLAHDYLDVLRQMETGASLDAVLADAQLRAIPEKLGAPDLVVTADEHGGPGQLYQPLLTALDKARTEDRTVVLLVQEQNKTRRWYKAMPNGTMTGVNDGGFGSAFGSLHPTLARIAVGRNVDLRGLFNSSPRGNFNALVAAKLETDGVPRDVLKALDNTMAAGYLNSLPHPNAKSPAAAAAGRTIAPTGHGMSISGP
ncbi:hypothetical protein AB0E69_19295 [Kribbella sp. NPDC026611]|uniref:hypothetical protein n=1 Tax=Kribbella sp. NPDC026611 TaxID=3154911 RepID=UPI0033EDB65F